MIGVWNWLRSYTIDIYWMSLYSVDNIKEKLVISLYAKGMSVSDIEEEMREIYEIELSTSAISIITNKVNQGCSGITEPPFGSGLSHRLDGWYCIQGSWQRKNHQQDCLSLCRFETERLERSPWHVGGKIRKFFILDGCPDRFEGPRSAGHIDYLHWQPERVYRHHTCRISSVFHANTCCISDQELL